MAKANSTAIALCDDDVITRALQILKRRLGRKAHQFTSQLDVAYFLVLRLTEKERETFTCLFLDNAHRLIAAEDMFSGSVNQCFISCREVVRRALLLNASAIIVAHNHPSGNSRPSLDDIGLTIKLHAALQACDIRLLDHFVIHGHRATSFASEGIQPFDSQDTPKGRRRKKTSNGRSGERSTAGAQQV